MADVKFSLHRAEPQVWTFDDPPQRLFKRIVVDDANEEEILLNEILRRLFFVRANQILHVTRTLHLQVGDITRELSQQLEMSNAMINEQEAQAAAIQPGVQPEMTAGGMNA